MAKNTFSNWLGSYINKFQFHEFRNYLKDNKGVGVEELGKINEEFQEILKIKNQEERTKQIISFYNNKFKNESDAIESIAQDVLEQFTRDKGHLFKSKRVVSLNEAEEIVEKKEKRAKNTRRTGNQKTIDKDENGLEVLKGLNGEIEAIADSNIDIYNRVMMSNDNISIYQVSETVKRGVAGLYLESWNPTKIEISTMPSENPYNPNEVVDFTAADLLPELYETHAKSTLVELLNDVNKKSRPTRNGQKNTVFAEAVGAVLARGFAENEEAKKWFETNCGLYILSDGLESRRTGTSQYRFGAIPQGAKTPTQLGDGRNIINIITRAIEENGVPTDSIGKSILTAILNQPTDPTTSDSPSVSTLFEAKFVNIPEDAPKINIDPISMANDIRKYRSALAFNQENYGDIINPQVGAQENIQESARNTMNESLERMSDIYADVVSQSILDVVSGHDNATARSLKKIFGKDGKLLVRAIEEVLPNQNLSFVITESPALESYNPQMPEPNAIVRSIVEKLAEIGKSQEEVQRIADSLGFSVEFDKEGNPVIDGNINSELLDKITKTYEDASQDELMLYTKNQQILKGAIAEAETIRETIAKEGTKDGALIRNHQWHLFSNMALDYIDPISQEIITLQRLIQDNQGMISTDSKIDEVALWYKNDVKRMEEIRAHFADEAEFVRFAAEQRVEELMAIKANTMTMIATGIERAYEGVDGFDRATIDMLLNNEVEALTISSHEDIQRFLAEAGSPENAQYRIEMLDGILTRLSSDPNITQENPSTFVEVYRDENGNFITEQRTQEEQENLNRIVAGQTDTSVTEKDMKALKRLGVNFTTVPQPDGTYKVIPVTEVVRVSNEEIIAPNPSPHVNPINSIEEPVIKQTGSFGNGTGAVGGFNNTGYISPINPQAINTAGSGIIAGPYDQNAVEENLKNSVIDLGYGYGVRLSPEALNQLLPNLEHITKQIAEKHTADRNNVQYDYPEDLVNGLRNDNIGIVSKAIKDGYVALDVNDPQQKALKESLQRVAVAKLEEAVLESQGLPPITYGANNEVVVDDPANLDNILLAAKYDSYKKKAEALVGSNLESVVTIENLDSATQQVNTTKLVEELTKSGKLDEFTIQMLTGMGKDALELYIHQVSEKLSPPLQITQVPQSDSVTKTKTGGKDPVTQWEYSPVSVPGGYATTDSRRAAIDRAYKSYLAIQAKCAKRIAEIEERKRKAAPQNNQNNQEPAAKQVKPEVKQDEQVIKETNAPTQDPQSENIKTETKTLKQPEKLTDAIYPVYKDLYNKLMESDIKLNEEEMVNESYIELLMTVVNDSESIAELSSKLHMNGEGDLTAALEFLRNKDIMNVIATCCKNGAKFYLDNAIGLGLTDTDGNPTNTQAASIIEQLKVQKEINEELEKVEGDTPEDTKEAQEKIVKEKQGSEKVLTFSEMEGKAQSETTSSMRDEGR